MEIKNGDILIDETDNDMIKIFDVCDTTVTYRIVHKNDPLPHIFKNHWLGLGYAVASMEFLEKHYKVIPKEVLDIMEFECD